MGNFWKPGKELLSLTETSCCCFPIPWRSQRVQTFLSSVKDDRLAKSLFQLAICCGSLEAPNDLPAGETSRKNDMKKKKKKEEDEEDDSISIMAPSESE